MIRSLGGTMVRNVAAAVLVLALGSAAWAQDDLAKYATLDDPQVLYTDSGSIEPASGLVPVPEFGLRAGYIKPRDADDGTWFGGFQVRVPLGASFAIEGSIEFHTSDFASGDIETVQYPVQASLLWYILPDAPVCPYVLGGLGWYYTRVSFSGALGSADDEVDSTFGAHLGVGARVNLGGSTLSVDLRYLFIEPNEDALQDEEFDSVELVIAISFPF